MLTLQWVLSGVAVLVALAALARARRCTKRLERLTESYWELRYDYGQLRARVGALDGSHPEQSAPASPAAGGTAFVPLSSLKR